MKKRIIAVLLCMCLIVAPTQKSEAAIWVVIEAALVKIVTAIDLGIQKAQNKVIAAQNVQKSIENYLSKFKLNEIIDWSQKQKDQYKKFYDELQQVKLLITYYKRIKDITVKQTKLVRQYERTWGLVKNDKHFTADEIRYMGKVYTGIMDETVKNIDQVMMVVNSFRTQMSDAKRLEIINQVADKVDVNYTDLVDFNQENAMLSLGRAKEADEVLWVKQMYGLK